MRARWPSLTILSFLGLVACSEALNQGERLVARDFYDRNRDGSPFLWLLEDNYHGADFFDHFEFFTGDDPTHGIVRYVTREEAFNSSLAYVRPDGVVIMKADDNSTLAWGEPRASVRVATWKHYTTGLFILDLNTAPWGCAVWPAWWSTSRVGWPLFGEIDIIEGVHDNEHNQIAWHTSPGCLLDTGESFTGNVSIKGEGPATNCDTEVNFNSGCSITEWSRASYGPYFDEQGGGVFAMKWDENGIAVWSFYRSAVPADVTSETPNPSTWGPPSAVLGPNRCDITKYFSNHTIIINITFCGDWAGNSYNTSGCPGTCQDRLMNPRNFENATWSINSLKVYRKQPIYATVTNPNSSTLSRNLSWLSWMSLVALLLVLI